MSGTLRVLPLGGVGEIGKNMTVVEYDGRIVVVDCGLRFPTAEMMGIDLVLPDFTYLREHVDAIEAIVITHGHEDHLGALPWVLRDLGQKSVPVVYGGQLDGRDGPLQARRAQAARGQPRGAARSARPWRRGRSRSSASTSRTRSPTPAASRSPARWGPCSSPATTSSTRRRSAARRPTWRGWPSWAARGCCCCAATRRTPTAPGMSESESIVGPHLERVFPHCKGRIVVTCFASNIHRVQQVVDAPRPNGRKVVAGRALDAQERQHRPHARPHRRARGHARPAARGRPVPRREAGASSPPAPRASRCRRCAGWPTATTRRSSCARATPWSSPPRPIPGNERAVNETIDRLYHIGCDVVTRPRRADPRLRPRLRRRS